MRYRHQIPPQMNKALTILLLGIGLNVQAQKPQQTLFLKPVAGFNRITTEAEGFESRKHAIGWNVGIGAEYKVNRHFSLEAALVYSSAKNEIQRELQKGGILQFPIPMEVELRETSHYHFTRLPINLFYKQDKSSPFYLGIGIGLSYNINVHRDVVIIYPDVHQETESGSNTLYMDNELSGRLGAFGTALIGKEWKVGSITVGGRLEYSMDITRWKYTTNYLERQDSYLIRNSGFSFNVYTLL